MLRDRGTRPRLAKFVEALPPQYLAMLKPNFHPWDVDDWQLAH